MKLRQLSQEQKSMMNRRHSPNAHLFKLLYIIVELVLVNVSFIVSLYILYNPNLPTFKLNWSDYLHSAPFLTVAALVYIDYFGMTHFFRKNQTDVVASAVQFVFLVTVTSAAIAYSFQWFMFSRWAMALGAVLMLVLTCLWSILCLKISKAIYSRGKLLIIAATPEDADRLYMKVRNEQRVLHIKYLGYTLADDLPRVFKLINYCTEVMVSSIISEADRSQLFLHFANLDKTIYVVPQFTDLIYTKFRIIQFQDMPTFVIDSLGLTFQQRLLKRIFDVLFSRRKIVKKKARMALASLLIMAVFTFSSCSAEIQSTSQASSNQTGTGVSTAVTVNDPIESTVQDTTELTAQASDTTQAAESTTSSCSAEMQSTSQASSNQTGTGLSSAVSANDPIESTVQDATKLTLQTSATTPATESTTGEAYNGSTWILTQYRDSTGSQAIFYTLSSNGGDNLIVIDGGTSGNAEYVRSVINDLGGVVDAWILTHPHPDHIGAFNVIYEDPKGIEINAIYDNGLDYDYYKPKAFAWDGIEVYEKYLSLTKGDERVIHPKRGDVLDIDGLEIQVFNTYDDVLLNYYLGDVCNESSLVFKIDFPIDSILFVGDCYSEANSEYLMQTYGDRLKATYVQMGHHGNNTLSDALYALVDPAVALFDAPDWLMDGENYTTKQEKSYMESIGATVYYYNTAPNRFELK